VTRTRRWIGAWVLCGLALRIAFALFYWVGQPLTHDEREYLAIARSLAHGGGFAYPADEPEPGTAQRFGRAPGYPLLLAALAISDRVDHAPRRVQVAQAFIGALGVWLIASIALRAAGPRAGVTAAAVAALYPPLIWIASYVWSETFFSTIALAAAWTLSAAVAPRVATARSRLAPRAWLAIAAALTGAAILVRPAMIFFVPFAAGWLWRRRALTDGAVFVLIAAMCVLPWTIRNHRIYGRWIAVASEGGVTFWTGNHPFASGDGDLAANPRLKQAELEFRAAHPGLTAEQREPLYYRAALSWIRDHPGGWLRLLARKLFYTVVPAGPSYALHSARYLAASVVSYVLVLAAALAGAVRWRSRPRDRISETASPAPLWLMAASTVAAGLVFFPQERFRIPVIDPALIVTAALSAGLRNHGRIDRHPNV
jgi:4-amino-4-deoxy-L-arabinose transferase-like glycosyltransferase